MSVLKIRKPKVGTGQTVVLENGDVLVVKPGICLKAGCYFIQDKKCKAYNYNFISMLENKPSHHAHINCTGLIGADAHFEKITSGV